MGGPAYPATPGLALLNDIITFFLKFRNNRKLRKINLSWNQLMFLPRNIFKGLTYLDEIHLLKNNIQCLRQGVFMDNPNLITVSVLKGLTNFYIILQENTKFWTKLEKMDGVSYFLVCIKNKFGLLYNLLLMLYQLQDHKY